MMRLLLVVAVLVSAVVTGGRAVGAPENTVQINVAQAPLDQVLRVVAKAANVNILIPPELAGRTVKDLRLQGLPADEALSTILMPFGYEAVLDNDVYLVRARPEGSEPLIHVGARLISLQSADFDRLVASLPPEQRLELPGGISLVTACLFSQLVPLLGNGSAQIIQEPHCSTPAGKRVQVPIASGDRQPGTGVAAANELLFPASEAFITPQMQQETQVSVLLELTTHWVRPGAVVRPTTLTLEVPAVAVPIGGELWVRGWQRLCEPDAASPGNEVVLALSLSKQPPGQ